MAKVRTFVIDITGNSLEGKSVSEIKITISIIKGTRMSHCTFMWEMREYFYNRCIQL